MQNFLSVISLFELDIKISTTTRTILFQSDILLSGFMECGMMELDKHLTK